MVEEISSYDDLSSIAAEWWELWNRIHGTVFQSPGWLLPWWRHMFGGGAMWTVAVREHDRLVGLAPLFIYGDGCVAFIGTGVSDYLGFLAEDEHAARKIWAAIEASQDRWRVCDLQEIQAGSPTLVWSNLPTQRCRSSVCPILSLPSSIAEWESKLSPRFRHHLRNSRNRLGDLGACFESGCGPDFVEALISCHTARWRSKGESGVLADPRVQAFFRDACAALESKDLVRFHALRRQGQLVATMCIFCAHGRHAYYLGGFEESLSRYSPGSALIHFAIERAIGERATEFDFLRQGESYKYEWGAIDRFTERLLVTSPASR